MERTWGPVDGFYVTAYAAPTVTGERFCSYAKVCLAEPASYWEADCLFKVFGGDTHATPEAALVLARFEAERQIARIPTRRSLAMRMALVGDATHLGFPLRPPVQQAQGHCA